MHCYYPTPPNMQIEYIVIIILPLLPYSSPSWWSWFLIHPAPEEIWYSWCLMLLLPPLMHIMLWSPNSSTIGVHDVHVAHAHDVHVSCYLLLVVTIEDSLGALLRSIMPINGQLMLIMHNICLFFWFRSRWCSQSSQHEEIKSPIMILEIIIITLLMLISMCPTWWTLLHYAAPAQYPTPTNAPSPEVLMRMLLMPFLVSCLADAPPKVASLIYFY